MPSYNNFESEDKKQKDKSNQLKYGTSKNRQTDSMLKKEKFMDNLTVWVGYWRSNPHRFVNEYLQCMRLKLFQKILLFMMFKSDYFLWFASRGLGKSILTAVYCVVRCILYPGTKICIAAGKKSQSLNIISEKIKTFKEESYLLACEISEFKDGINDPRVNFHNGSYIKVVTASDNARSNRANVIVVDEFIQVPFNIIKKVLTKFLTTRRQPGFLKYPEYAGMQEPNTEIYLSSIGLKSEWYWDRFKSFLKAMLEGKRYFACGMPYHLGILSGFLDKERILNEMQEEDFDRISFSTEMECLPYGESENAFFNFKDLNQCRKLKIPSYPITNEEYIKYNGKLNKNRFYKPKKTNELRILTMDIALMGGNKNDLSVIHYIRAIPNGEEYTKLVEYTHTMEGDMTDNQALTLKRLFYDLECDICVMDTAGNSLSVYEACTKVIIDPERGTEYPAWVAMNGTKEGRAYDENAVPLIYSVGSGGKVAAELNHKMAMYAKSQFQAKKVNLLIHENEAREYLKENYSKLILDSDTYLKMILPYFQTTRLVSETVNLEMQTAGGFIKLVEPSGHRKDRYKSLEYGLYYIKLQETKLKQPDDVYAGFLDDWDTIIGMR